MYKDLIIFKNYNGEKIDKSFEYEEKDEPLVKFFNKQSAELVKKRISTIKTITYNGQFIGYYSISMSSIEAGSLFDEKRSATWPHPAIIIGRILLDKRFRHGGFGTKVILSIIFLAKKLNQFCACRFIIVDAKKGVEGFYEKTGFLAVKKEKQRSGNTTTMLFDLN